MLEELKNNIYREINDMPKINNEASELETKLDHYKSVIKKYKKVIAIELNKILEEGNELLAENYIHIQDLLNLQDSLDEIYLDNIRRMIDVMLGENFNYKLIEKIIDNYNFIQRHCSTCDLIEYLISEYCTKNISNGGEDLLIKVLNRNDLTRKNLLNIIYGSKAFTIKLINAILQHDKVDESVLSSLACSSKATPELLSNILKHPQVNARVLSALIRSPQADLSLFNNILTRNELTPRFLIEMALKVQKYPEILSKILTNPMLTFDHRIEVINKINTDSQIIYNSLKNMPISKENKHKLYPILRSIKKQLEQISNLNLAFYNPNPLCFSGKTNKDIISKIIDLSSPHNPTKGVLFPNKNIFQKIDNEDNLLFKDLFEYKIFGQFMKEYNESITNLKHQKGRI